MKSCIRLLTFLYLALTVFFVVTKFSMCPKSDFVYPDTSLSNQEFIHLIRSDARYAPLQKFSDGQLLDVWVSDTSQVRELQTHKNWPKETIEKSSEAILSGTALWYMYYDEYGYNSYLCFIGFLVLIVLIAIFVGVACFSGKVAVYGCWGDFLLSALTGVPILLMMVVPAYLASGISSAGLNSVNIPWWFTAIFLGCGIVNVVMAYKMNHGDFLVNIAVVIFRATLSAILAIAYMSSRMKGTVNGGVESDESYQMRRSNPINILQTLALAAAAYVFIRRLIYESQDLIVYKRDRLSVDYRE